MSGEYIGGLTVGGAVPFAASATALASATATAALLPAQARLAGALQAVAALQSPTVGASAGVAAQLVAELGAIVLALEAQLAAVAQLETVLSTAGVHLYRLDGPIGNMGADLGALTAGGVPGGTADQIGAAFVFIAADNGTIAALESVFAG
jgi:hypothetical protein